MRTTHERLRMGSTCITRIVRGKSDEDHRAAYRRIRESDLHEYGADPYSGSFATTDGVELLATDPVPAAIAERIAHHLLMGDDLPKELRSVLTRVVIPQKWGAACAIPVLDDSCIAQRTKTVRVSHQRVGVLHRDSLIALAEPKLGMRDGEWLGAVRIVEDQVHSKSTRTRSSGKRTTVYRLRSSIRGLDDGGVVYDTEKAAIEAAQSLATLHAERSAARLSEGAIDIIGEVRRGGGPLASVSLSVARRTTTIEATIERKRGGRSKLGGYYLFAWAAC